jgi:RNA recognition motif-containing protein
MHKIFVANVPSSIEEEDLKKHFQQAGKVISVKLVVHPRSQESRGFAFIEMKTALEVKNAIKTLYGKPLKGTPLYIKEAQNKKAPPFFNASDK